MSQKNWSLQFVYLNSPSLDLIWPGSEEILELQGLVPLNDDLVQDTEIENVVGKTYLLKLLAMPAPPLRPKLSKAEPSTYQGYR